LISLIKGKWNQETNTSGWYQKC